MVNITDMLIVTGVALLVNVISAVGRRFLTDVERTRRVTAELKAFNKELRQAIVTKNKAKEEKLRKKKKKMDELQAKVQFSNLKVSLIFLAPFMGLYWLISSIIGLDTVVAVSPIPIYIIFMTIGPKLSLFWWYMISSFAFSSMIAKLLGVSLD